MTLSSPNRSNALCDQAVLCLLAVSSSQRRQRAQRSLLLHERNLGQRPPYVVTWRPAVVPCSAHKDNLGNAGFPLSIRVFEKPRVIRHRLSYLVMEEVFRSAR